MAGITSTKKIKGQPHLLAYITPNEVEKLKALGGQETMTKEGIPAYPEYDNYGYSSQSDFDKGDVSKSNDPNVRNVGTFETYKGNKNVGVDLALKAKYAKDKKDREDAQKALDKGQTYGYGPNQSVFEKMNTYNTNYQTKRNRNLAQKRAFQKYRDIEQYVDLMDDYGLTAEELAAEVAANPSYGYDFSSLDLGKKTLGSNIGTNLEKYRTNLYDVNSKLQGRLSILNPVFDKVRPDTQVTALNTLNKARDYNTLAMDPNISREKLEALANRGKTPDQIDPPKGDGGGGQQVYLPYEQLLPEEEAEREQKEFAYRFGNNQNVGADVTRASYIFNQGGRVPRAFGGIMDTRQGYLLGGVADAVGDVLGSVGKAAKKVLSSDLGKAAIAGAAFYYGGGGMNVYNKGSGFFSGLGKMGANFMSKSNPLLFTGGKLSLGKLGLASAALPFLMPPAKPNEDIGMTDRGGRLIDPITGKEAVPAEMRASLNEALNSADGDPDKIAAIQKAYAFLGPDERLGTYLPYRTYGVKDGGRIRAQEGGLMNLGGMEKDYRNEGGFVPIGKQEKADDVPARLSVNEFVFTADAVRNAGGGDIDKGAEVMENMMKNLENGGRVSEESQGNTGAQEMFSVSERIGEVI